MCVIDQLLWLVSQTVHFGHFIWEKLNDKIQHLNYIIKSALTSSFWCPRWFLLIRRFTAIVVLFFPTSSSDWAKQHSAGLEESNKEWLFGLRPIPPNDSSRFYVDTPTFTEGEKKRDILLFCYCCQSEVWHLHKARVKLLILLVNLWPCFMDIQWQYKGCHIKKPICPEVS